MQGINDGKSLSSLSLSLALAVPFDMPVFKISRNQLNLSKKGFARKTDVSITLNIVPISKRDLTFSVPVDFARSAGHLTVHRAND